MTYETHTCSKLGRDFDIVRDWDTDEWLLFFSGDEVGVITYCPFCGEELSK